MQPIPGKITALQNLLTIAVQRSRAESHAEKDKIATHVKQKVKYGENDVEIPVDFSFLQLATFEDAEGENPRNPLLDCPRDENFRFEGKSLRLNNNQLTDIEALPAFVNCTFKEPKKLAWIDLSFNALRVIHDALLQFPCLQILYLHGNQIDQLSEINKLAGLSRLRKLTLHGNPIEEDKSYKMYVTATLPHLKNISFSAVTKCQAATASSWKRMNNPAKKKKKKINDD